MKMPEEEKEQQEASPSAVPPRETVQRLHSLTPASCKPRAFQREEEEQDEEEEEDTPERSYSQAAFRSFSSSALAPSPARPPPQKKKLDAFDISPLAAPGRAPAPVARELTEPYWEPLPRLLGAHTGASSAQGEGGTPRKPAATSKLDETFGGSSSREDCCARPRLGAISGDRGSFGRVCTAGDIMESLAASAGRAVRLAKAEHYAWRSVRFPELVAGEQWLAPRGGTQERSRYSTCF
jgi:hypothetical protein